MLDKTFLSLFAPERQPSFYETTLSFIEAFQPALIAVFVCILTYYLTKAADVRESRRLKLEDIWLLTSSLRRHGNELELKIYDILLAAEFGHFALDSKGSELIQELTEMHRSEQFIKWTEEAERLIALTTLYCRQAKPHAMYLRHWAEIRYCEGHQILMALSAEPAADIASLNKKFCQNNDLSTYTNRLKKRVEDAATDLNDIFAGPKRFWGSFSTWIRRSSRPL